MPPPVATLEKPAAAPPALPAPPPRQEYIAAGGSLWLPALLRALPQYVDDVTRDFGRDLYTRMLWDPAVQSATRLLRESATSALPVCTPAVDGEVVAKNHAEWAQADRIATFSRRNLARCTPGIGAVLYELSEATTAGHRLGENVWEQATLSAGDGVQWVLAAVKVKEPTQYAFVVDPYHNQPGVLYAAPGQPLVATNILLADGPPPAHYLPRDRYTLYTHWPQNGDPRGRSILRAAYHAWWAKKQTWKDYLQYLACFASPMLFGTTAPNAQPGDDGVSPVAAMATAMETLRNAGVMAAPAGALLQPVQTQGEGRAFLSAVDLANHEITLAVLMATRATMEAEHGSRADSGTAQDVVELGVARLRSDLAAVTAHDILAPLLVVNYGPDALRYLPVVSLGAVERHDFAAEATALAALARTPVIHRSMLPALRALFGLPAADENQEATDLAQSQALAEQIAKQPPVDPNADAPPADQPPPPAKKGAPVRAQ